MLALPERIAALEQSLEMLWRERPEASAVKAGGEPLYLWNPGLSPKELELLPYIAAGWSNQEIANEMGLEERTVRTHVSHILSKLNTTNRTTIALWALATNQVLIEEAVGLMGKQQPHMLAAHDERPAPMRH